MKIDNYNERLKGEYRTLVVAFLNAVEKSREDREKSAAMLFDMAKKFQLTDKESMTADWLRNRVYQPEKYKHLPQWLAKSAYLCLMELGWAPTKQSEWFAMVAMFVRERGGDEPDYDELSKELPINLEGELGFAWLKVCVEAVRDIQQMKQESES
ncbi:hypothetical protein F7Q91_15715 [Vibrio chagasii]|uniref:Uncharacterized protein n=1 Tax=Vibrio chagasii TaxID=170679 RepID=A0A7V7TFQ9_9VIBR|nr:hypothetical protein [Vibrio chagasii]KAB0478819.1 hypothetical protein F7Q91_15715 [Vibrio chagasii]